MRPKTDTPLPAIPMLDTAQLYLKHQLIGTPLEPPLRFVQYHRDRRRRRHIPHGLSVAEEDRRIDAIIERTVQPADHCWDIGGHLGSMSAMLTRRVGPAGRVDTVEPDAQKARWLRRRLPHVHECALADEPGETTFFINVRRRGFSGLRRHGSDNSRGGGGYVNSGFVSKRSTACTPLTRRYG